VAVPPAVELAARVSMVPIAAKYLVRGSSDAGPMVEFLTGVPVPGDAKSRLRALAAFVQAAATAEMVEPLNRYLSLVESSLK